MAVCDPSATRIAYQQIVQGGAASNRFWLLLVSIGVALRALYLLSYRQWRDLARNAFELPMFSWLTAEKTLNFYRERPPIILQLFLAIAILVCGFVLVRGILGERRERHKPAANSGWSGLAMSGLLC